MEKKPFDGFGFSVCEGKLIVDDFGGWETRNESCIKLIKSAINRERIWSTSWIYVNTGDRPVNFFYLGHPTLNFSTVDGFFELTCPDFVFDHWSQTGLEDYQSLCIELGEITEPASTDYIGWRGALTAPVRQKLVENFTSEAFDFELVNWIRTDSTRLTASNFLTLPEQVRKWRFLIDIEGTGYSGRLKLLLHTNRVIFIQERPWKEFFFPELIPWTHFVPIKRDLSDLEQNLNKIRQDPKLESVMISNAKNFAKNFLGREIAITRWAALIQRFGSIGKLGRNVVCPCGSSMRFKHCHGAGGV